MMTDLPDHLLQCVKEQWEEKREGFAYTDVDASYWKPGEPQVENCPSGCNLEIYEQTPTEWGRIPNHDAYRQTRFCSRHGFARIYVITGVTGSACKWIP
jgi:hypothetical protein